MKVLVVGATSAIAQEACRAWAARGDELFLVARDAARLEAVAQDARVRGARRVETALLDALDFARHDAVVDHAWRQMGGLDAALVAHGTLTDQARAQVDWDYAERELRTNFLSVASLLERLALRFEAQRGGVLAVVSSVAGDRGRASNYAYGAAKAATTAWASGLRGRLHKAGVRVVTIKPGLVETPMTAHLPRSPLSTSAGRVGRGIVRAMDRGGGVTYLPGWWRFVFMGIKALPEAAMKRLRF